MRRRNLEYIFESPVQNETTRLEQELSASRSTIVGLMPDAYSKVLRSYWECQSTTDFYRWQSTAVAKIIEQIPPAQIIDTQYYARRVECPLCSSRGNGFYGEGGYKYPTGIEWHLAGHGNTHACPVTEAAFALGRDYVKKKYGAVEEQARAEEVAERERRRKVEIVYKVDPNSPPKLLDDGILLFDRSKVRSDDDLAWAEQRVRSIGFTSQLDGNVKTIFLDRPSWVVYADIRRPGKLEFDYFEKPVKKKDCGTRFILLDRAKHDLKGQFQKGLDAAMQVASRRK